MDTFISILSVVVASLSLCYTIKAYKSQRRTERNTLRWSPQRERDNLRSIARELVFSYRRLLTVEYKLVHSEIRKRPQISSFVFSAMMINENALHADDYYGDEIDYEGLYQLSKSVNKFNKRMEILVAKAEGDLFQNEKEISFAPEYTLIKNILQQTNLIYNTCFDSKDKKLNTLTCIDILGLDILPLKRQSKISANKIVGTRDYIGRFDRKILEASFSPTKSVVSDRFFILPFIIYVKHVYNIIDEIEIDGNLRKLVESMWNNIPEKCTAHKKLSDEDYRRLLGILLSKESYINDITNLKKTFKSDYLIDLVLQLIRFDSQAFDLCYPQDIITIPSDSPSVMG